MLPVASGARYDWKKTVGCLQRLGHLPEPAAVEGLPVLSPAVLFYQQRSKHERGSRQIHLHNQVWTLEGGIACSLPWKSAVCDVSVSNKADPWVVRTRRQRYTIPSDASSQRILRDHLPSQARILHRPPSRPRFAEVTLASPSAVTAAVIVGVTTDKMVHVEDQQGKHPPHTASLPRCWMRWLAEKDPMSHSSLRVTVPLVRGK